MLLCVVFCVREGVRWGCGLMMGIDSLAGQMTALKTGGVLEAPKKKKKGKKVVESDDSDSEEEEETSDTDTDTDTDDG